MKIPIGLSENLGFILDKNSFNGYIIIDLRIDTIKESFGMFVLKLTRK